MLNKLICTVVLLILINNLAYNQGVNNLWLFGYYNYTIPPFGGGIIDFSSGTAIVDTNQRKINFSDTNASICDDSGNLLFSSNGIFIANATGDTMVNGAGINPSFFTSWYTNDPYLLIIPQADIIIPVPGSDSLYYLFHSTVDTVVTTQQILATSFLYYSIIDMSLDSGRGAVISKNNIAINDTLNIGKVTAVKHANGRDWWVVCHKMFSNQFFRLLVTPDGVFGPFAQSVGMFRRSDGGQVCFSPDGSRFAYYFSRNGGEGAQIFNFDRCSGMFSQPYLLDVTDTAEWACGVSFSPNSNLVYVSTGFKVWQFDCSAPNINSTKYLVAEWDSFYSPPGVPFATTFYTSQLAPDGKIYICSTNTSLFLHVIHNPDNAGPTCNMVQHGLQLPVYNGIGGVPNHPNYFLGALPGSACDSITGIDDPVPLLSVELFPNPVSDHLNVSYLLPQNEEGELVIVDAKGSTVASHRLSRFSTIKKVDTQSLPDGLYNCLITSKHYRASRKFVKSD